VFQNIAGWGKNSLGWHFGFKLHLIINDLGELLAFKLTPGNVDDRKPIPEMTQGIFGKLFGERGYISQDLFEKRKEQQLQLITRSKKNMKQKLVKLMDKILLRKRALIETVNDPSGSPVAHGGNPQDRTGLTNSKIFFKLSIRDIEVFGIS